MARSTLDQNLRLADLEAPQLDLADADAPEAFLTRLRTQNFALDRLRHELAVEDLLSTHDLSPAHPA